MNILFTGVGRRIELIQAFRNAALTLNKKLHIYGSDMDGTAPALAYCDYVRQTVGMKDALYVDELLSICRSDCIDLLIPTIDTDLLVLSQNKKRFENAGTHVMISEPEMIQICRDKSKTSQFFTACGLHAPVPVNDWKKYDGGFPAFIKPKDGSSSINAFRVENYEELQVYSERIQDYIIQPFVEGKEYTIDVFCKWNGEPITIIPRERVQVRAGEVLKTRIFLDEVMIDEVRKLCKAFRPCGPMTVQLIRDAQGVDWYIEINPRFGGGAPLSMRAGARSAEAILKLFDGEDIGDCVDISDGAVYSRFDQSVCVVEGSNSIRGIIFDLDDTLYSEKEYIRSGYKAVSDYLGGGYEEKLWKYFEEKKQVIDELLKELGHTKNKEKVINIYRSHKPSIHLYYGVIEMLNELRARGIKVGIITDGRPLGQHNKFEALGLGRFIDDFIITDELGGTQFRKPCDIAFRIMSAKWKLPFEQIVYVGDNPIKDFQAPKQLGMKALFFKNADGIYSYEADVSIPVIESITSVSKRIKN